MRIAVLVMIFAGFFFSNAYAYEDKDYRYITGFYAIPIGVPVYSDTTEDYENHDTFDCLSVSLDSDMKLTVQAQANTFVNANNCSFEAKEVKRFSKNQWVAKYTGSYYNEKNFEHLAEIEIDLKNSILKITANSKDMDTPSLSLDCTVSASMFDGYDYKLLKSYKVSESEFRKKCEIH